MSEDNQIWALWFALLVALYAIDSFKPRHDELTDCRAKLAKQEGE